MDNKEKNFVPAVVYVHNAENRIEKFLKELISVMEERFDHSEIICVNDCSDDNSLRAIRKVSSAAKTASVSVVNMSCFHGLEAAMAAGMDLSISDFVFEFDNTVFDSVCSRIKKCIFSSSNVNKVSFAAAPSNSVCKSNIQKIPIRAYGYKANGSNPPLWTILS